MSRELLREKPDHGWVKGDARVMSSHGVDIWVMAS